MNNSYAKFITLLKANRHRFFTGIVHDFQGSAEEL
jgi:Tat protein secretion system quality control protein TatD with DNase activity